VFAIADSVPVIFKNHGIRVRGGIGFSINNLALARRFFFSAQLSS
jgi:hypothetical protein